MNRKPIQQTVPSTENIHKLFNILIKKNMKTNFINILQQLIHKYILMS